MLSKDNTCRARCSLNFGAIARETERERGSCAKKVMLLEMHPDGTEVNSKKM